MNAFHRKLLAAAAAITKWATIQPGALFALTSGIGGEWNTRVLWRGTDSSISLWKLDPGLNCVTAHVRVKKMRQRETQEPFYVSPGS
jgi:hypothetical protein